VAFRIFPEHVEVDVLHSDSAIQPPVLPGPPVTYAPPAGPVPVVASSAAALGGPTAGWPPAGAPPAGWPPASPAAGSPAAGSPALPPGMDGPPGNFAEWMSSALRREGLTQEAAARQLGVSVKTVSRWVGGATEPRMRDLRRIQELFGEVPLP
jgi:DNA-binding XRE family transcriptional regulator